MSAAWHAAHARRSDSPSSDGRGASAAAPIRSTASRAEPERSATRANVQRSQKVPPQRRQWCRRTNTLNRQRQPAQRDYQFENLVLLAPQADSFGIFGHDDVVYEIAPHLDVTLLFGGGMLAQLLRGDEATLVGGTTISGMDSRRAAFVFTATTLMAHAQWHTTAAQMSIHELAVGPGRALVQHQR